VTAQQIPVIAMLDGTLIAGHLSGSLTYAGTPNAPISYLIDMAKNAGG
jgi:hypothetical protein